MQRFSFVVLPTLLLLVMFSIGCQNDHEERIAAIETKHAEKIALLETELLRVKYAQASDDAVIDALFYKVICDGEHVHEEYNYGAVTNFNAPLNLSLVYSNSETGEAYDLQPLSINPPYRAIFRHLICDGVSGGITESVVSEEQFDPDKHPIQDLTLTNAILVQKLCNDNFSWEAVHVYVEEEMTTGLRDLIWEMCNTHYEYMRNYEQNPTGMRGWDWKAYQELRDSLYPPEETAAE